MSQSNWLDADHPAWTPPAQKRVQHERSLQQAVTQYLRLALPKDAVFLHLANHGRTVFERTLLASLGQLSGAPDMLLVWRGRAVFIELKSAQGALSRAQRIAHRRILAAGAPVWLCRSIDEVQQHLAAWGMPLSARTAG